MPYRIAGIDVHKKMLAVVVADVEIDGDFHFERQKVGTTPSDPARPSRLAGRARGRGSRDGIHRAGTWRPVSGSLGAALAATTPRARRCAAPVGHPPSRASAIESRARRSQEGLPGCGTVGETAGRPGADSELRTGHRAAPLAHRDAAGTRSLATAYSCTTGWRPCSRKRTSRCPASSRTCSGSAPVACCRPWRTARPIRAPSPCSRPRACAPHRAAV